MDGMTPAAPLPPVTQGGLPPIAQPSYQNPRPPPGVVGRPSADPEVQQQRVERNVELKRIEGVLPKQLDSKVLVFKADKKGRLPMGARPVLQILVSELEESKASNAGMSTDQIIEQRLEDKFSEGRFVCKFVDRGGKSVPQYPPWEVIVGANEDGQTLDGDDGDDDDLETVPEFQQAPSYPQAPQPTGLDISAMSRTINEAREQEARRGNETASLIASTQTSMTQMMAMFQQQQQARDEAARQEAIRRDEAIRQDAIRREEAEKNRRSDFRQTILAIVPLIVPLLSKWFGPKEHAPDPAQAMMFELFKSKMSEKGSDAAMMENVMKVMGTMTEQQMKLQSAGAATAVQMQSEASSLVFKNMMSTMKELLENKKESKPEDDSMMKTIIKAAAPLLAGLAQQPQQAQQPQPGYDQQQPQAPQQAAPVQQDEQQAAEVRRPKVMPPPPQPQPVATTVQAEQPAAEEQRPRRRRAQDPAQFSDDQRIGAALDTVRKLSTGEIPADQRFQALQWAANWAPAPMVDAIKSGDREQVMTVGQAAVMASPVMINWLATDGMPEFLEAALADMKLILSSALTKEQIIAGVRANMEFVQRHAARPVVGEVVKPAETIPPTGETILPKTETPPASSETKIPPIPRRRRAAAAAAPETPPAADGPSAAPPEPPAPTSGG